MPRVVGTVSLPSLATPSRDIEFLVDVGAAITVLRFDLLPDLGIDLATLGTMAREQNAGAGGAVMHARHRGQLAFRADDGTSLVVSTWFRFALEAGDDDAPSVLGMNVLRTFRVVVSAPEGRVALADLFA